MRKFRQSGYQPDGFSWKRGKGNSSGVGRNMHRADAGLRKFGSDDDDDDQWTIYPVGDPRRIEIK